MTQQNKARILIVDDDRCTAKLVALSVAKKLNVVAEFVTEPVSPHGYDFAVLDWQPHGPEMVARCQGIGTPFVVFTGDISKVPRGCPAIPKPRGKQLVEYIQDFLNARSA